MNDAPEQLVRAALALRRLTEAEAYSRTFASADAQAIAFESFKAGWAAAEETLRPLVAELVRDELERESAAGLELFPRGVRRADVKPETQP